KDQGPRTKDEGPGDGRLAVVGSGSPEMVMSLRAAAPYDAGKGGREGMQAVSPARCLTRRDLLRAGGGLAVASAFSFGLTTQAGPTPPRAAAAAPLRAPDEVISAGRDAALEVLRHLLVQVDGFTVHWAGDRYRNPW